MRPIILASRSPARKKLLKQLGLKFRAQEADIREGKSLRKSCGELVRRNALKKALAVAAKRKTGVVIGADTIVSVGGGIIGKPRSLKDAVRTLKILSRQPQWVYSGIAVVDIENRKTYSTWEKTRVFMSPLTEGQIRKYFQRVSPLDKAGSFDIQGLGSVFISRVEGCFYNVVGLPLSKLASLLRKTGIEIF